MKSKKTALFNSVLSLMLCISMLLGTTFAWFTDSVTSENNIIKSGRLDAEMYWKNPGEAEWKDASTGAIFNYEYWEPGYVETKCLKLVNAGNLAFQYRLFVVPNNDMAAGMKLAEVLDVYVSNTEIDERTDISGMKKLGTLKELMVNPNGVDDGVLLPTGAVADNSVESYVGSATVCIALKMQETAGNEYQNRNFGDGFKVQLLATQYSYENDSFGADYDANAAWPEGGYTATSNVIDYTAAAEVTVNADNTVAEPAAIGNGGEINAEIPAGVKLAEGATALELSVKTMSDSEANVTLENGETKQSLDIHVAGVSEDNAVPMTITLPGLLKKGLNTTSVAMYHVEDGVTVPMDLVTSPTNHNEFSYDPATGDVVICTATFSEYVSVTDDFNRWEGGFNYDWYVGKSSPYTISSADQLAGFGRIIDGTAENIEVDTFEGKTVELGANIDLSGGKSFNPIGYGYVNEGGKPFSGTFDGQNHTIFGLNQNGWDLGLSYCTAGGGLFASVANGTIQNLTVDGANVIMECVDMGILVGYSQGVCHYENINIYNSKIANYQRYTGGVVGEVSALNGKSTHTFTNVHVGPTTVIGTLWGDFDAACGGIIGGKWDSTDATEVVMKDCTVACRLDVYNDVTAAYEWYAYRRAGMLIGNSEEPAADGKNSKTASASYLTCENVKVYYDTWTNYTYCQFRNEQNPGRNYPWVRVQLGENNSAYSNPRYGHPVDTKGTTVTTDVHYHDSADQCRVSIPFNQLYGGGQGVYGAATHDGVTVATVAYDVVYMDGTRVLEIEYVTDNSSAHSVKDAGTGYQWLDAEGNKVTSIAPGNTKDVVLQKDAIDVYIAYFVNHDGITIYEEIFTKGQRVLENAPAKPPQIAGYVGEWEAYDLAKATGSIVIRPIYTADANTKILVDVEELFDLLEDGESVVMNQNMEGGKGNASQASGCQLPQDQTALLNLNAYELSYNFTNSGNKQWKIFHIEAGATLTLTSGIYDEGTLKMNLDSVKNTSSVFYIEAGGRLILEKGVTVELTYPPKSAELVSAFGSDIDLSQYPNLTVDTSTDGLIRIVANDTTIIQG